MKIDRRAFLAGAAASVAAARPGLAFQAEASRDLTTVVHHVVCGDGYSDLAEIFYYDLWRIVTPNNGAPLELEHEPSGVVFTPKPMRFDLLAVEALAVRLGKTEPDIHMLCDIGLAARWQLEDFLEHLEAADAARC